jgi:hypothetical protein
MRARSASRAQDWRWSSVRAHLVGRYDGLVVVAPMLERSNRRFGDLIDAPASSEAMAALRGAETIGRARITRLPMSPRAAHGARSEALRSGGSSLQGDVLSIEPHKGALTNLSTTAPFLLAI